MTIVYFSPFIIIDDRCRATLNGKVIWKCNHLLELLEKPDILMDEKEYTPQKKDNDFVGLGGWEFNVSSTIYPNATPDEVIKGWNMFNKDMRRDIANRLFQPFFYHAVIDANLFPVYELRNQEPEMIELLRLSYWYYRCSIMAKNSSFPSKRKEIREKVTRGLLFNVEEYKTTVEGEEFINDMEEFRKKLKEGMINAKKGKPQDENFRKYMKEIPKSVWGITSELIFAGISNDHGYCISFDIPGKGHDYDFIVKDIPCQVKTVIPEQKNAEETIQKVNNRINELSNGKKIEEDEIKKETFDLLHKNKEDIKKAIQQGGRIIYVNGTKTYAGFLLNQWASDNNINLTIHGPLQSSISLLREENSISLLKDERKFLPLIFGAAGIDYEYRFSTWSFKVPINLALDDSKLNLINRI